MTEDGIKVALTAEELELLKALAWTSGESSPELFARTQLLVSLGAVRLNPQGREQVRKLSQDLRRLHEELKGFLADGASGADLMHGGLIAEKSFETGASGSGQDVSSEPEVPYTAPTRFSFGRMTPSAPGASFPGYHRSSAHAPQEGSDDLEEMAGKAFAISPRLGAFAPASPQTAESFAPSKKEQNAPIVEEIEQELEEVVTKNIAEPIADVLPELAEASPNTVEIPKIDVPGLEADDSYRFDGDPLVDLLDQELLKLAESKPPTQVAESLAEPIDYPGVQPATAQNAASNSAEDSVAATDQEGNTLAEQVIQNASLLPELDNAEIHQSFTEELVDWVNELKKPVKEDAAVETPATPEPAQSSPFLSVPFESESANEVIDDEKGIAATSSDPALLSDDEDNNAGISTSTSESKTQGAASDSTALPRPPKIKPVELSGNSPPRKRRS